MAEDDKPPEKTNRTVDAFVEYDANVHDHVQLQIVNLLKIAEVGSLAIVQCIYPPEDGEQGYALCAHVLCARIKTTKGNVLLPIGEISTRDVASMRPPHDTYLNEPKVAVIDPALAGRPVKVYQDEEGRLHVDNSADDDDDNGKVH